jgi:ATP-dependent exoDNAse (exonuclease V) beta subunit
MSSLADKPAPPDEAQREMALDPGRSVLVEAPAGSGKTDLLTRRFLRLLAEVKSPGEVVAITFTNAAAAEMRHRILAELERAAAAEGADAAADRVSMEAPVSMEALARGALDRSRALGWNLLALPAQLRILTIDAFCRELALQQPLLSGLGGGLGIAEQPKDLYRRAARRTLEKIDRADAPLREAIETLLLWRDNGWMEMEDLLVEMLGQRDRWMRGIVLDSEQDMDALRERLERPFARAVQQGLEAVCALLGLVRDGCERAIGLARFACAQAGGSLHRDLAELADFPTGPFAAATDLEQARQAHACLSALVLTGEGAFRRVVDKRLGFPADRKREKAQMLELIGDLASIPGLEAALAAVRSLPPARYTEEDWEIVRACFLLLRQAAAELQVVFAEAGAADFIEVAQIAQRVLADDDGLPTDAALAAADGVRHLLVDEFQDTSRRQHQLLASLVAAWPERTGRSCFAVGDPMQSIYFFREADAELFPRVRTVGLEIPNAEPLVFDSVALTANFRTAPPLVDRLNQDFARIFAADDGSGIAFSPASAARDDPSGAAQNFKLHLQFGIRSAQNKPNPGGTSVDEMSEQEAQCAEIVDLIETHLSRMEAARQRGAKYRIAVLGRARSALAPVAEALRKAEIPFRAVDLEKLGDRPEVLDALALARALFNPEDRVAWLGVLRAPWCGLALDDLHRLTSNDDPGLLARPIPDLLAERAALLSPDGRRAAERVVAAVSSAPALRAALPTASLGTWLEQIWLHLGGADCVDATARANLHLLWNCLDKLTGGEQDLLGSWLGSGLGGALDKLTALPDPGASGDCGVQLMTIHKSKGLEFEIVIVPELQARGGRGRHKLLSWLERGVAEPDDTGEITEFLIAPLPPKGADRGKAKEWVDRVYRERESQEDRRVFYVAATRAREELHLFARPALKADAKGDLSLPDPADSLLATAWPALEDEVRACFAEWQASQQAGDGLDLAASGADNLLTMPSAAKPSLLRRLPADYRPPMPRAPSFFRRDGERVGNLISEPGEAARLFTRHEGGPLSRALGNAIHSLLEELARLRGGLDWEPARAALQRFEPRIAAQIRSAGIDQAQANQLSAQAMREALKASHHPAGQWILSPHAGAASEIRWAGVVDGAVRTVQVDRVFRSGLEPRSEGDDCWWVVDYKTAREDEADPGQLLPRLRELFAPQVEAYGAVLRNLHGRDVMIHAGLYYPRMLLFDWWEL